nr:serine/threonine-protein kinase PknD [uncultured bacterium]
MEPPDLEVQPGDVVAGKYRIERVLGHGGMGIVVRAHHIQLDEKVALKFLLPSALKRADVVSRFDREARAAVRIKSEHVARVTDVGHLESGAPYMVMEYLEGVDLGVWLRKGGPLPIEEAAELVLQACEALAEAHGLGIVHRDLKPANLFCIRRADGLRSIKVLDFGISKLTAPGSAEVATHSSVVLGTAHYMSPEQIQASKGVDARTDIWSLGVILFELVTGQVPFQAEAVTEVVVKIVNSAPPSLRRLRPDLPAGFERLVMRCLEKDRDKRLQNVADLAVLLGEFAPARASASVDRVLRTVKAAGLSEAPRPGPGVADARTGDDGPPTSPTWGRTEARSTQNRARIGFVLAASVALATLGTVAVIRSSHRAVDPIPSAGATGSSAATASQVEPAAPAELPPAPTERASAASTAAAAPSSTAIVVAPPTASPPPRPAVRAVPTRPVQAAPVAKPVTNCNPPYTIDAAGHRIPKPECL